MARIDALKVGEVDFHYTALGGRVFDLHVTVSYPEVGTYSSTIISEDAFLSSFSVTSEKNSFYLVPEEGKKLTKVTLDPDFDEFADVVVAQDGSYATVTVTGDFDDGCYYGYSYEGVYVENAEWTYSGMDGLSIYDGRDGFYFRYAYRQNGVLMEDLDGSTQNKWDASVNEGSPAFFYVREGGVERRLIAADLVSSDESVVKISADSNNEYGVDIYAAGLGEATISYTSDKATYTIDVTVGLPEFGFYTSNQVSEEGYIREFTMTDSENTFYVVAADGWTFTEVVPDAELKEIADVTVYDNYIVIVLKDTPSNGCWYGVEFDAIHSDGRERNNDRMSIRLYNGMPVLGYRYASHVNEDGEYVVDTSSELYTEMNVSVGSKLAHFFFISENGVETPVTLDQLTSSNTDVVTLTEWKNAVVVNTVGVGESVISCEVNGKVYEMTINVDMPLFGFYTTPEAIWDNYIDEFTVTDTEDTFYYVSSDSNWKITKIDLVGNYANGGTATISPDGSYAIIELNGTVAGQQWLDIEYTTLNVAGDYTETWSDGLLVKNERPYLGFCWPDDMSASGHGPVESYLSTAPGYATDVWVYLVEGSNETMVAFEDLVSSDPSVVEVVDPEYPNGMVNLKTTGWGTATVSYTVNGKTYSFNVISELQTFGYYTDDVISQENWTREFTVTDTNKTLYFMAQNGVTWDSITPNAPLAEIATVEINAAKNIATITFTGIPDEEEMYGFDFQFSHADGWSGEGNDYIEVKNGTTTQEPKVEVRLGRLDRRDR